MFNNLTQFVPSHVCLECDGCCRFKEEDSHWRPKVGSEESQLMRQEGLAERIFGREHLDAGMRIKTKGCHNGTHQCRFFSPDGNLCTIYAYRPFECRLYPFVLMKKGAGIVLAVHLNCPHVQNTQDSKEFDNYVGYLQKFFLQNDVTEFLKRNRLLIESYLDYEDEMQGLFNINV